MTDTASGTAPAAPVISVSGAVKSFADNDVLRGVSFSLAPAESVVVLGGSGAGKSVFFKCLTGLLKADQGNISVLGGAPGQAFGRIGMLFQGGALFDSLPVWENIAFEQRQAHGRNRLSVADARDLAARKLAEVDLEADVADRFPAELSGGMIKRVALARAIAFEPELLFFDEPTAGLDPVRAAHINALIRRSVTKLGAAAITITHDLTTATTVADRVLLLHEGRFVWDGSPRDLFTADNAELRAFIDPLREQQQVAA